MAFSQYLNYIPIFGMNFSSQVVVNTSRYSKYMRPWFLFNSAFEANVSWRKAPRFLCFLSKGKILKLYLSQCSKSVLLITFNKQPVIVISIHWSKLRLCTWNFTLSNTYLAPNITYNLIELE